ncbi:MAG: ComF family protein [Gammaproteobacteria bacterium]|nr:ComF family protein [Gammaproteobacteria bacterium]
MKQCWWHKKFNISNIIPRHCLFCLQKTQNSLDLCDACIDDLSLNNYCCQRCALPLEPDLGSMIPICGNCLSHHYYYNQVVSPFGYTEDMAYLIKQLKYHQKIHYADLLATLFIVQTQKMNTFQLPQIIIPVPMHHQRLKQRGYNQALELARVFSSYYQLPLDYSSLIRSRYTQLQAEMSALKRQQNIKNAFIIKKEINYTHIALIDDVMTTGSTVNEVAKVLKHQGVKKVDIWSIARAGWKH